jgi:hypothetical protein
MVWYHENDLGLIEIHTQNSEQGLPTKVAELSRGPTAGHFFTAVCPYCPSVPWIVMENYGDSPTNRRESNIQGG